MPRSDLAGWLAGGADQMAQRGAVTSMLPIGARSPGASGRLKVPRVRPSAANVALAVIGRSDLADGFAGAGDGCCRSAGRLVSARDAALRLGRRLRGRW